MRISATEVVRDEGTMIVFAGIDDDGINRTFAADRRAAGSILAAMSRGHAPVCDVPRWALLR